MRHWLRSAAGQGSTDPGSALAAYTRGLQRPITSVWPLIQMTAASTIAWIVAKYLVGNHEPFFAPVATIAALNRPLGERGLHGVRIVAGVFLGILTGELTVVLAGGGYGNLAVATFAAMALARALRAPRIIVGQAASSAILTVAVADGEVGTARLVDALIGVSVALVFTQLLFSPEPVALLRRAEQSVVERLASGISTAVLALDRADDALAEQSVTELRELRDDLTELARLRIASVGVVSHSPVWREQRRPLVRENENAGHLDLLASSCLGLTRRLTSLSRAHCEILSPSLHVLTDLLRDLGANLDDVTVRQRSAERALQMTHELVPRTPSAARPVAAAAFALEMVAIDIMAFTGVDPDEASAAVRGGVGEFRVPVPPATPRIPFLSRFWRQL